MALLCLELIVVIGIVAFLSNVVVRQISTGLKQKNLDATIDNVAVYFSNASRLARAFGAVGICCRVTLTLTLKVTLRQMGTYEWFEGVEPTGFEDGKEIFMDINDSLMVNPR